MTGLPRLPKWGHLKELHRAIKLCEHVLLNGKPVNISLGPFVEVSSFHQILRTIYIVSCLVMNHVRDSY